VSRHTLRYGCCVGLLAWSIGTAGLIPADRDDPDTQLERIAVARAWLGALRCHVPCRRDLLYNSALPPASHLPL